ATRRIDGVARRGSLWEARRTPCRGLEGGRSGTRPRGEVWAGRDGRVPAERGLRAAALFQSPRARAPEWCRGGTAPPRPKRVRAPRAVPCRRAAVERRLRAAPSTRRD